MGVSCFQLGHVSKVTHLPTAARAVISLTVPVSSVGKTSSGFTQQELGTEAGLGAGPP